MSVNPDYRVPDSDEAFDDVSQNGLSLTASGAKPIDYVATGDLKPIQ